MRKVLDSDEGIQCESNCKHWYHRICAGISKTEYSQLAGNSKKHWSCNRVDCIDDSLTPQNPLLAKLDLVVSKLSELTARVERLDGVPDDLKAIKHDLKEVSDKLRSLEPRVENIETRVSNLESNYVKKEDLETKITTTIEQKCLSGTANGSVQQFENFFAESNERDRRARNSILHGLRESTATDVNARRMHDQDLVAKVISLTCPALSNQTVRVTRIGKKSNDCTRSRPLLVSFTSKDCNIELLKYFSKDKLKDEPDLSDVSITPDRTPAQRAHLAELRAELQRRKEGENEDLTIKFIHGIPKIVPINPKNE